MSDKGKMSTTARLTRQKISTAISPRTLEYLESLISSGEARNLAEAWAMERLTFQKNRERLEDDPVVFFKNMRDVKAGEKEGLKAAFSKTWKEIDFAKKPPAASG